MLASKSLFVCLATVYALSGCGGGDGGDGVASGSSSNTSSNCVTFSGATRTNYTTSGCVNCAATNTSQAVDGNIDTAASVTHPAGSVGTSSFRATAQSGIIFTAGNTAAIVFSPGVPEGRIRVLTYQGDVLQENRNGTSTTRNGLTTIGIKTTKNFDAVEFSFDAANPSTSQEVASVREFCSNSNTPILTP